MLLALALCALPQMSLPRAGFLRDARTELRADGHFAFEGRIQWPATATRTSFVVEGLAPDGSLIFERPVKAHAPTPAGHHLGFVRAKFELALPALDGVAQLRVRFADVKS
jgi:hypothetical protein